MTLTLKEQERLAYIEGDVKLAGLLGALKDAIDDIALFEKLREEWDD